MIAWIVYLVIALSGSGKQTTGGSAASAADQSPLVQPYSTQSSSVEKNNIRELSFLNTDDITLKVGQSRPYGFLKVKVKQYSAFTPEDVLFVSDDPQVASISFTSNASQYLYFEITGIGPGETYVYATSKDGSVISEKIRVTVPKPITVSSIDIQGVKNELVLGESIYLSVAVLPENAEDKSVIWVSSDASVAVVSNAGVVTAMGGGSATISVKASNGPSASYDITVDGSRRAMNLKVSHIRQDDNNIGDEWSYVTQINGEETATIIILAAGDRISYYAEFTEADDNPDVGKVSGSYKVTDEDIINGFSIVMDLYVKENGGINSGKSAHFVVTYIFTP